MKRDVFGGALAVVVLDRATKLWAAQALKAGSMEIIPGVLAFTYAENTGMAFSLFAGHPRLLAFFSLALLVCVLAAMRSVLPHTKLCAALKGALLGGGIGNAIDRLVYGCVIDFIEPRMVKFAIFNVADIAVTLSALALAVLSCTGHTGEKRVGTQRNERT